MDDYKNNLRQLNMRKCGIKDVLAALQQDALANKNRHNLVYTFGGKKVTCPTCLVNIELISLESLMETYQEHLTAIRRLGRFNNLRVGVVACGLLNIPVYGQTELNALSKLLNYYLSTQ